MKNRLSTFDAFKHLAVPEDAHQLTNQELRHLQQVLVDMLDDIHHVFASNDLPYILFAGSCLGAVRHGGFIPWDDDLDIALFRGDYERFLDCFNRELADRYTLQTPMSSTQYGLTFARIRKKGTVLKTRDDYYTDEECGIFIDVFIFESVPNNTLLRILHGFGSLAIGFCYSCRRFAWLSDYYKALSKGNQELERVFRIKTLIGRLLSFAGIDSWTRAWYSWNSMCKRTDTKYIVIPNGRKKYFGDMYERSTVFPPVITSFDGIQSCIPADPHRYLTVAFGEDYMTPPPKADQEKHIVYDLDFNDGAIPD